MGNHSFRDRIMNKLYGIKPCNITMLGLDAAGKTTILYKLKLGEVVTTIPTRGFNVETLDHGKMRLSIWDMDKITAILTRHYLPNTQALIYVVDSNDRERINDNNKELRGHLYELSRIHSDVPLLVMANKQDLPNIMSIEEITEKMELDTLRDRQWHIQPCCAKNGDGLLEGLDWLHLQLMGKAMKQAVVKPIEETAESVAKSAAHPGITH